MFYEHFLQLDQPVCPSAQFGWTGPNMLKHRLQQWREKWDNVRGLARDSPRRNSPRCSPPRRNSPHQRERHPRSRSRHGRQSRNGTVTHRTLIPHPTSFPRPPPPPPWLLASSAQSTQPQRAEDDGRRPTERTESSEDGLADFQKPQRRALSPLNWPL